MRLLDLYFHLRDDVLPIAIPLCIVVAAAELWRRTRRASALLQLIGSLLLLYGMTVQQFGWHTNGLDAVWSEPMRISKDVAALLGGVLFPVSYLFYALHQKRI